MKRLLASTLSASMALTAAQALAATPKPLSATDSDAKTMGWMQGFPPAADKTIRFTAPDYFAFPKQRWTVCNFRQLMPTVGVARGAGAARALPQALDASLDQVSFTPIGAKQNMTWAQAFDAITPMA